MFQLAITARYENFGELNVAELLQFCAVLHYSRISVHVDNMI